MEDFCLKDFLDEVQGAELMVVGVAIKVQHEKAVPGFALQIHCVS